MKSPTTVIKHLERAICIQEMIKESAKYRDGALLRVKQLRTDKSLIWYNHRVVIRKTIMDAWKYRRIHNYLRNRFALTISKI